MEFGNGRHVFMLEFGNGRHVFMFSVYVLEFGNWRHLLAVPSVFPSRADRVRPICTGFRIYRGTSLIRTPPP